MLRLSYLCVISHLMCVFGLHATVKVGILHSLSGTLAISEKPVADATTFAISEINARGGVLGHQIEPVTFDGASDSQTFAKGARELIEDHDVSVIFGCWTSASRKTVKPVVEKHEVPLFYPVQYEGVEQSSYIVYTGAAPNQQVIPGAIWAVNNLGSRVYLVGSDYVFPHVANAIIKDMLPGYNAQVVGESYVFLGADDVTSVIDDIEQKQPDIILNTINGDTNVHFFKALRNRGITPERIPSVSFSISERELETLGVENMISDYACWGYFQSVPGAINQDFVRKFKDQFGKNQVVSDPMEAAYTGVHFWAKAAERAGSFKPSDIMKHIVYQFYPAPQGIVYAAENNHTWRYSRIGKIRYDGQFAIIWDTGKAIQPVPYPESRTKEQWQELLDNLYTKWGNRWENIKTS